MRPKRLMKMYKGPDATRGTLIWYAGLAGLLDPIDTQRNLSFRMEFRVSGAKDVIRSPADGVTQGQHIDVNAGSKPKCICMRGRFQVL